MRDVLASFLVIQRSTIRIIAVVLYAAVFNTLTLSFSVFAAEDSFVDYSKNLQYLPKSEQIEFIDDAIGADDWVSLNGQVDLGYNTHQNWFRAEIPAYLISDNHAVIEVDNLLLEDVEFFLVVADQVIDHQTSGSLNKLSERQLQHGTLAFPLVSLSSTNRQKIYAYLRVKSESKILVPIHIWQRQAFDHYLQKNALFEGFYLACGITISIFYFLYWFRVPSKFVFFYGATLLFICIVRIARWGYGYEFIWPDNPLSSSDIIYIGRYLVVVSIVLFHADIQDLKQNYPAIYKFYIASAWLCLVMACLVPAMPLNWVIPLHNTIFIVLVICITATAATTWYNGAKEAKYIFLSVLPGLISVPFIAAMEAAGNTGDYLAHVNSLSTVFSIAFLALAIAQKISDNELISAAKLTALNFELEEKVADRTQSLNRSLTNLKQTQHKLIEAEKVAAMTGLVSGIAQKINTPLDVCISETSSLRAENTKLQQAFDANTLSRSALSTYLNHSKQVLETVETGLNNSAKLVTRFKSLAIDNSDNNLSKPINLRDRIEDSICYVSNSLMVKPTVHLQCDESLVVETSTTLLDHLLSQLLKNSIDHAFEQADKGEITISADLKENELLINYSDNGKGLSEGQLSNLFDPFTQEHDDNSGFGTASIYNIVVYGLKGKIECHSAPNQGLAYQIRFPVVVAG